jgi:protein O-GlcNAc transferase
MESTDQLFDSALNRHQAGALHEAEEIYKQILAATPDDPDVLQLLGMVNYQLDRKPRALEYLQKAVSLNPLAPDSHYHLGMVLEDLNRPDEAAEAFRQATVLKPDFAEAHHRLGLLYRQQEKLDLAEQSLRQAIIVNPQYAEAHNNLATVLKSLGKFDESIASYRQALALRPDLADIHANLGNALSAAGKLEEAVDAYRQSLALKPDNAEVNNKLGVALVSLNRPAEALVAYWRGLASLPNNATLLNNIGNALLLQGDLIESVNSFRKAIDADPKFFLGYNNLGNALKALGMISQAVAAYSQAVSMRNDPYFYGNMLFCRHFLVPYDAEEIFQAHLEWERRYSGTLAPEIQPHLNSRDANRRLKIGYVSSDLRQHSVAYFLENLLSYHDPHQVEVFVYADVPQPDVMTRRLQQSIHQWRPISGKRDEEVTKIIRQDGIDILVDLAGHTAGNRLLVFARKPAPIQITYLGYPDTTGMSAMDYRMTDVHADPAGMTEKYHSEKLLRLPRTFASYRPPAEAPDVSPLPALTYGRVTFASFTTLAKLPHILLDCWTEILLQIPASRLIIAAGGLQANELQKEIRGRFERKGIDPTRLDLMGKRPFKEYFALHHQADVYLDTFPVNGHTVTCHALWMGLPVITLAGEVHCQRLGASVLSNLGMGEMIAKSPKEYVEIAKRLSKDIPTLKEIRSGLRDRMKGSPILDAAGFASDVEAAYRDVWRKWCGAPR